MKERQRNTRNGQQRPPRHGSRFRRLAGLLLGLAAVVQLAWGQTALAAPGHAAAAADDRMAVVAAMQPGWNLGNTLDAIPDETAWGNPLTTQALLDTVRAQGYHSIRIPVTWSNHQSASAPYTIDADVPEPRPAGRRLGRSPRAST